MNKKKKIIITSSVVGAIILLTTIALSIYFIVAISFSYGKPLKDKEYTFKNGEITSHMSNDKLKFDTLTIQIKQISYDEYNNSKLINVFYDYNYEVYYKLNIKLTKNGTTYNVESFCYHYENITYFYRPRYSFDLKIGDKIYENAIHIKNYGSLKPEITLT